MMNEEGIEMNIQELNILKALSLSPFVSQRILAESLGYALGTVNQALRFLVSNGYLYDLAGIVKN